MTVVVAGSVCLDLIPALPAEVGGLEFRPGVVVRTGAARIAPGGCVANTGGALHRLGVPVRLLANIGDDAFGRIVQVLLAGVGAGRLRVTPEEATSHSFILSPPGYDRMILNCPGANNTFTAEDVPTAALGDAQLFHFGYPPAMAQMFADSGRPLVAVLAKARTAGLLTALDMSYPDPASAGGRADWPGILAAALPLVDLFMPSLAEALLIAGAASDSAAGPALLARVRALGERFLQMGAAIVVVKLGEQGLYLRTAPPERVAAAGGALRLDPDLWARRELWGTVFATTVVGTTGAGDATAAGLLLGLERRMTPEQTITAACAVGASSLEAADAISAVTPWEQTAARVAAGWARRAPAPGPGWHPAGVPGTWRGPADGRHQG